jgi:hypothetical protein
MPAEHGSWSWLLVPFGVGAVATGRFDLPMLLTLVAGLAIFLMRQPATVWLRARRGRARAADGPVAAAWAAGFGLVALACCSVLLLLGRGYLLWLTLPLLPVFALYLLAARRGRAGLRSLGMELSGAAALAMMAPAAMVVGSAGFTGLEWPVWGIMAIQNILGALYVRLRIYDTHRQAINRPGILWSHLVGVVIILILVPFGLTPLLVAIPFIAFLARATWAVSALHPVGNVKRFGFTEMGIEIASGAWIAIAYRLA